MHTFRLDTLSFFGGGAIACAAVPFGLPKNYYTLSSRTKKSKEPIAPILHLLLTLCLTLAFQ